MLNLDLLGNGDSRRVNLVDINQALQTVDPSRKVFIASCLEEDPSKRPTAAVLIKSRVLQEVTEVMEEEHFAVAATVSAPCL